MLTSCVRQMMIKAITNLFTYLMRRDSVLAGLRDKKFEAIHEKMLDIVFCKSRIFFK